VLVAATLERGIAPADDLSFQEEHTDKSPNIEDIMGAAKEATAWSRDDPSNLDAEGVEEICQNIGGGG